MATRPERIQAFLDSIGRSNRQLSDNTMRYIDAQLAGLARGQGFYSDDAVESAARRIAKQTSAARRARAASTAKFTQMVLREMGEEVKVPSVDVKNVRTAIDDVSVWERPAEEFRFRVSEGKTPAEALKMAQDRGAIILDDELQLAGRKASQETLLRSRRTIGYRRVIHPELSAGGTCGLCIAASTRLYKVEELRAIHANCKCESVPVFSGDNVAEQLNTFDIKRLYGDNLGSTDGRKLKYLRYQINEHGELGPVITRKGHNFKGPSDVDAPHGIVDARQATALRDLSIDELNRLLARKFTGENVEEAITHHREVIKRMTRIISQS